MNFRKIKNTVLATGLIFGFAQIFSVEINAQKTRKKTIAPTTKKKIVPKNSAVKSAKDEKTMATANLKITKIDALALRRLVKRDDANTKPLLVNFWATWCPPCVDEFPELVKIDADYKDKIDFITVSLDDLAEINRDVPEFLTNMKAMMPAYLLKTQDEQAAVASISKNYQGALPFTVLFDGAGAVAYTKQGKVDALVLRGELERLLKNNQTETK